MIAGFNERKAIFFLVFVVPHLLVASYISAQLERDTGVVVPSPPQKMNSGNPTIEPLPIISYDTDVGVGYGAKCFFLNQLRFSESFDCVAFNSTKGERWYRFVFSLPDFEQRQGKTYPLAVDVIIDYDKLIKNSFFGIGNRSEYSNREYYTREPIDISLTLSKGYSATVVVQGGARYKSVRNYHFQDSSAFLLLPPENSSKVSYQSLFFDFRYDTRNSFVNPSLGAVVECNVEESVHASFTNSQFTQLSFSLQHYSMMLYPATVLALRAMVQGVLGSNLPVQVLPSVGGNTTVRGSPQDRFLDDIAAVVNAELRFPIYWRFGGVAGFDAGRVWHTLADADLARWAANPVAGLRFYRDTFIVRLDVGFGRETTGVYFNFGQLF